MSSTLPETTQKAQGASSASTAVASATSDDVIDLRVYLNVLARWWKEILLIGVLCGVGVGAAYWLLNEFGTPSYEASADAAIIRTISEVTLDERFITTSENPAATAAAARRNALIALAQSPALAMDVIAQLGEAIPNGLRNPAELANHVDATMASAAGRSGDSDLIRIVATTDNPDLSSLIANAWAQAFVRNVNQVYGQVPDELVTSLGSEQEAARINYEAAQKSFEDFLARSRVDELARSIEDKENAIDTLRNGRTTLLATLVASAVGARGDVAEALSAAQASNLSAPIVAEQEGKRNLINAYVDAIYSGQTQIVTEQSNRDIRLLQGYYARWLQATLALDQAQALLAQTQVLAEADETSAGATGSGSSAMVLALLKLRAFTSALDDSVSQNLSVESPADVVVNGIAGEEQATPPGLLQSSQPVQVQVGATPLQLQISDTTDMTNEQIIVELTSLIDALTQYLADLNVSIEQLGSTMTSGENFQINAGMPISNAMGSVLPALVDSVLGSNVITGTAATLNAGTNWDMGNFAALYNTNELRALADATSDNDELLVAISAAEDELRSLRSALEAERTTQLELTQARDLAQDAYRAANSKLTELTLARAGAGGEVRFAAPAIVPVQPLSGPSAIIVAAAATIAGLLLGIVIAFIADAMGATPFLARRKPASHAIAA